MALRIACLRPKQVVNDILQFHESLIQATFDKKEKLCPRKRYICFSRSIDCKCQSQAVPYHSVFSTRLVLFSFCFLDWLVLFSFCFLDWHVLFSFFFLDWLVVFSFCFIDWLVLFSFCLLDWLVLFSFCFLDWLVLFSFCFFYISGE